MNSTQGPSNHVTPNPTTSSQVDTGAKRSPQRPDPSGPDPSGPDPSGDDAHSRIEGEVRWFSDAKGYGFIVPDDGHDDVFVRQSSILRDGFRALEAGQRVRFRRTSDQRGPRATEVRVI